MCSYREPEVQRVCLSEAVRSEQRETPALMALKGKEIPPRALIYIWRHHVT